MRQETIKIYTIEDHPNKEACLDWIRNNWHDLGEHVVQEMVDSLKALASAIDGKLNYSLSIAPDHGEFVKITEYNVSALTDLYHKRNDLPLTGMSYDYDVIRGLFDDDLQMHVVDTLHTEGEYIFSEQGLTDTCIANEYEFKEDGSIH